MSGFSGDKIKFRHPVRCGASGRRKGEYGTVGAGWEPTELKSTEGGAIKALPSCLAHHPEVSGGPPAASP